MPVSRIQKAEADGVRVLNGFKLGAVRIPTLADNYQLTVDHPPIIVADPQAATKDLLLPLASTAAGLVFIVVNIADAAENIVVKDSTDTTTIATVAQTESVVLVCDGVSWYGLVGANT